MKKHRGFASMDKVRRREIQSMGGKAAHKGERKGHEFTREEAVIAGRKGGLKRQAMVREAKGKLRKETLKTL